MFISFKHIPVQFILILLFQLHLDLQRRDGFYPKIFWRLLFPSAFFISNSCRLDNPYNTWWKNIEPDRPQMTLYGACTLHGG